MVLLVPDVGLQHFLMRDNLLSTRKGHLMLCLQLIEPNCCKEVSITEVHFAKVWLLKIDHCWNEKFQLDLRTQVFKSPMDRLSVFETSKLLGNERFPLSWHGVLELTCPARGIMCIALSDTIQKPNKRPSSIRVQSCDPVPCLGDSLGMVGI